MMKNSKKSFRFIVIIVAVLVIGVAAISLLNMNKASAEDVAQQMVESLDNIRQELTENTTLHIKMKNYKNKWGIDNPPDDVSWIVPENTIGEVWLGPVDSKGVLTKHKGILKDYDGNTIQEVTSSGNIIIYHDFQSGEKRQFDYEPVNVDAYLQSISNTATDLLEKGWSSEKSYLGENESIVFEKIDQWKGTDTTIPGTTDLKPERVIHRIEVSLDNPLIHREKIWIVDKEDNKLLIEEKYFYIVEVLEI